MCDPIKNIAKNWFTEPKTQNVFFLFLSTLTAGHPFPSEKPRYTLAFELSTWIRYDKFQS